MGAACGRTRPACGEGARSWAGVGSGAFSREGLRAFGQPVGGVAVGAACRNLSVTLDRCPGVGGRGSLGSACPGGGALRFRLPWGRGLLPESRPPGGAVVSGMGTPTIPLQYPSALCLDLDSSGKAPWLGYESLSEAVV